MYMVKMAIINVQRAITSYVGNPVLWFMCSALQCSKGNNFISRKPRVVVHVFCTALHLCEVS